LSTSDGPVVAGFDGSEAAERAVRWAAGEARIRGLGLLIVYGTSDRLPRPGSDLVAAPLAGVLEGSGGPAVEPIRGRLAAVVERVHSDHPDVEVRISVRGGSPDTALTSAAEENNAAMIVLGESSSGTFARALLGTTEDTVRRTAGCPVVVVRGDHPDSTGPVVLGADGSEHSADATHFAFDFAARHGLPLHAVHGWTSAELLAGADPLLPGQLAAAPPEDFLAAVDEQVDRRLQPWVERYPEVEVRRVHSEEPVVKALTDHSADAALLVVGGHGHGELWQLLRGSVGKTATRHAHCPVAVVRSGTA